MFQRACIAAILLVGLWDGLFFLCLFFTRLGTSKLVYTPGMGVENPGLLTACCQELWNQILMFTFVDKGKIERKDNETRDPGPVFVNADVQHILNKVTRYDPDKVFKTRLKRVFKPTYKLSTAAGLQEVGTFDFHTFRNISLHWARHVSCFGFFFRCKTKHAKERTKSCKCLQF